MIATQTSPSTLRTAVCTAVWEGAWSPADIVASVATDYGADRGHIVATLWDLVAEGLLCYDPSLQLGLGGFRPL